MYLFGLLLVWVQVRTIIRWNLVFSKAKILLWLELFSGHLYHRKNEKEVMGPLSSGGRGGVFKVARQLEKNLFCSFHIRIILTKPWMDEWFSFNPILKNVYDLLLEEYIAENPYIGKVFKLFCKFYWTDTCCRKFRQTFYWDLLSNNTL